ncbi:uncharacterized protein BP5553_01637 [Venustampulla echinocandica]|uniref:Uncharacterized protein n=1 Tax=Venustampulla echinocandica TaxID=2656787 RepID=A0A370U1L1_9HELO|nr:uncharacterized protein BP5553_01637 [Venustampulla echinocandica]RDL41658.1 hypothetical protein BP5553_01637 [Venustampulla echinocandica]
MALPVDFLRYIPSWSKSAVDPTSGYRWPCFPHGHIAIYAWPSRGGVIILDYADVIDFEFLGLNPQDLPVKRLGAQAVEDGFCQELLLLGGKWWDNEARHSIVTHLEAGVAGLIDSTLVEGEFRVNEEIVYLWMEARMRM